MDDRDELSDGSRRRPGRREHEERRTTTTGSTSPGRIARGHAAGRRRAAPATPTRAPPRPRRGVQAPARTPTTATPSCSTSTLGRLVADHGWELDLRVHGVFARWAEIVGDDVAEHGTPESFADGPPASCAPTRPPGPPSCRLLAPSVVRRLNEELGHGTVTVIEVLGPHVPKWTQGPAFGARRPGSARHLRLSPAAGSRPRGV